ncbi:amine oxidase [Plakobranchus ocellatus]|uniref:Amine oxidase n=1 Tax=Plakobranchus ocellatus TaxID=259542 RepID=A0AAV4APR2_9GAST|nr:amine oxidase [Plakobranchus ocellatus]
MAGVGKKQSFLTEEKRFLKTCIILSDSAHKKEIKTWQKRLEKIKDLLMEIKENKNSNQGPTLKCIQSVLNKHKIVRQAFHGGHFIGNHSHKYLVKKVYKEITKEIITTVGSNTQLDCVISKAFQLESKFNNINDNFRAVHLAISHAHPVSEKQIEEAQRAIEKYMLMYRQVFPTYVTPKHHILERHCVAWLKRCGFGMGFHGEQGGEMLHSTVAKIERGSLGLRQESKKLACVLETSLLQTAPELTHLLPQGFLRDSTKELSRDSYGFLEIPRDSLRIPPKSFRWIPRDSSGFLVIPRDFEKNKHRSFTHRIIAH